MRAVASDLKVGAIKIGMLATGAVIEAVAEGLQDFPGVPVVLDPVMVAASGDPLLDDDAVATLRSVLMPVATLITPNLAEAAALLGLPLARNEYEMAVQALKLNEAGANAVLIKGGHAEGATAIDILFEGVEPVSFEAPRAETEQHPWHRLHAVRGHRRRARQGRLARCGGRDGQGLCHGGHLRRRRARWIGQGRGPVHHFHAWWDGKEMRASCFETGLRPLLRMRSSASR